MWGPGKYKWQTRDIKKGMFEHYELTLLEGGACTCTYQLENITSSGANTIPSEEATGVWALLPNGASGVSLVMEGGLRAGDWRKKLTQLNDVILMNF